MRFYELFIITNTIRNKVFNYENTASNLNLIITKTTGIHCVKYRNFIYFRGVGTLWKPRVSTESRAICLKLCESCAFPQNFYTRTLGEVMVFYAVIGIVACEFSRVC